MSETENSKEYELSYLLAPEIAEEKLELETAELLKIISENGGEAIESNPPQKRWLAYHVKKQSQAYFGVIYFNTDKENISVIKKNILFNKNVLRFLIVNKFLKNTKPIIAAPLKTTDKTNPETIAPSFEQKLENILRG
ncbi:MAG: 30S ribosomal protein S6 [Parcubacteria group bacterium]|nr:30S ribosomal protein S6 [Parcubacteria group bacterium]